MRLVLGSREIGVFQCGEARQMAGYLDPVSYGVGETRGGDDCSAPAMIEFTRLVSWALKVSWELKVSNRPAVGGFEAIYVHALFGRLLLPRLSG
jgi:hypothetical protein